MRLLFYNKIRQQLYTQPGPQTQSFLAPILQQSHSAENKIRDRGIPSSAEIRKATNILSSSDASATVVKIGDPAIKYGNGVTLLEAQTLDYVSSVSAFIHTTDVSVFLQSKTTNSAR